MYMVLGWFKKSLKIPKGGNQNLANQRIDNTMVKRKKTTEQTMNYKPHIKLKME